MYECIYIYIYIEYIVYIYIYILVVCSFFCFVRFAVRFGPVRGAITLAGGDSASLLV